MYDKILVRFGELSTKGKNKMSFVRHLEKNIKKLMGINPEISFDRIFINYSQKNLKNLQYIFGIQSYSPTKVAKTNIKNIKEIILTLIKEHKDKTFKIVAKRHWKQFEMSSNELNNNLGGFILKNSNLKVDVKNPELKIEVEIRKESSYIFLHRFKGLGGYPTGVNGKVLHLMSGGIDSPVAAYELMKRGLHVDYLSFVTPPHTDEKTIDKVNRLVELLNRYQGKSKIYRSTYTDLMNLQGLTSNQSYKITLMRRSFYRIATEIAKQNNFLAISNGENIGQVASQTLESIHVIQQQTDMPVFRPILTADKLDTINKAIKIGTYKISIEKANESCEIFAPKKPVIKPTIIVAQKLESELSGMDKLENNNVKNIQIINFDFKI